MSWHYWELLLPCLRAAEGSVVRAWVQPHPPSRREQGGTPHHLFLPLSFPATSPRKGARSPAGAGGQPWGTEVVPEGGASSLFRFRRSRGLWSVEGSMFEKEKEPRKDVVSGSPACPDVGTLGHRVVPLGVGRRQLPSGGQWVLTSWHGGSLR